MTILLSSRTDALATAAARLQTLLDARAADRRPVVGELWRGPREDEPAFDVWLGHNSVLIGPWPFAGAADGVGPCRACALRRWERIRPDYERDAAQVGSVRAVGVWPLVTDFLADTVWRAFEHALAASPAPDGMARLTSVKAGSLQVTTFPVLADAACAACGKPPERAEASAGLSPRAKIAPDVYRGAGPEAYPLPEIALANPLCGAIGNGTEKSVLWPTTAPVSGMYKIRVGDGGLAEVRWSGQAASYRLSRALGFVEGLERYAGVERGGAARARVATLTELGDEALDPRVCGLFDAAVYEQDPALVPFHPDLRTGWVPGWSLGRDAPIQVPSCLVWYGPDTGPGRFVQETSNGCASGGSLEEAVLFGLLEVIERDAFLLGWYGGAQLPRIDLRTCANPRLRLMVERAAYLGYDVFAFDNRIDLPVPVVTGLAVRRDGGDGYLSFAAAASLDPEEAVLGAVSEILTYIPALRERLRNRRNQAAAMARDFSLVRSLSDHPFMFTLPENANLASRYLDPGGVTRSMADTYADWAGARPRTGDLLDDIACCRALLAGVGLDCVVVDQTRPEQAALGLRTAKVLVPGSAPIDFGWSRQRVLRLPRLRSAFARWPAGSFDPASHLVPHPFP